MFPTRKALYLLRINIPPLLQSSHVVYYSVVANNDPKSGTNDTIVSFNTYKLATRLAPQHRALDGLFATHASKGVFQIQ